MSNETKVEIIISEGVVVRPGDTLFVRYPGILNEQQRTALRSSLEALRLQGVKAVVFDGEVEFVVARSESADEVLKC